MNTTSLLGIGTALTCVLVGCGEGNSRPQDRDGAPGSDGSERAVGNTPLCGPFTACGGSVVGVWKSAGRPECGAAAPAACPEFTVTGDYQLPGTMTFAADGTYHAENVGYGTERVSYPKTCYSGTSCRVVESTSAGLAMRCGEDPPGRCYCEIVYDHYALSFAGTYSTANGLLTTVETGSAGAAPETMEYCVEGDTLRVHMSSVDTLPTTLVLTKQ